MSDSSTNVGNITARLVLDGDAFQRDMAEARSQADRLDGRNVNVHVRADGVDKAAESLAALEVASNRYRIAELNLEDVMSRGNATEQERLRAQNALTTAGMALDRATANRAKVVRDETAATDAATAAEDANTAAQSANAAARKQNNDATQQSVSALQVFLALSPLAVAGADSIGAAAVGMATDFSIMAAAGAAAIAGIKDAMEKGTVSGQVYAAGLASLKTDLDLLEQTSAQAFLSGFSTSVDDVNRAMPVLNQLIGTGAQELGSMASTLVGGLLTGLEQMNPLITAGGQALGEFVGWLSHMTATDGFQQFVAYAVSNMPSVIALLEQLVTLAGNLLAAFAPLGPVVVDTLGALTELLNSLPLPVLAGLTTGILALPAAFKLAGAAVSTFGTEVAGAEGAMTLFGISANLAIPVVGILTAGLAALTIGIASSSSAQQQAIPSANAYADALERDGNAIGDNTTKLAEHNLAQAGAYDAVGKLGLGYDTLTQAATGNTTALHLVQDAIDQANSKYQTAATNAKVSGLKIQQSILDQKAAADLLGPALNGTTQAIQQQLHINQQTAAVQRDSSQADRDKAAAQAQLAGELGTTTGAIQAATDAQQKTADAADQATVKMQLENDAAGLLKAALDGLNGKALSAAQAQNAFDSSLANMGTHVNATGKQIHFTTSNINDMSAASVALRGQLNSQVQNLQNVVEANGGLANSTGKAKAQMEAMRTQIINNAVAHGVDRDAVTQYIDKILQIPASVPPTKIEADTAQAEANLARVRAAIDAIHDKTVTVTTVNTGGGQNAPGTGGGVGLVHANALGGTAGSAASAIGYFALGGAARGTDSIPTMLTPGEEVIRRPSADMMRRDNPGALEYINRHGQLPPQQAQQVPVPAFPSTVRLVVDGREFTAYVDTRADQRIGAAARDAASLRPGLG